MDFLFLGLGNPTAYQGTRHNVGKDLVEGLACEDKCEWHQVAGGRVTSILLGPQHVACMVSDGFMNETGQDMREALLEIDTMILRCRSVRFVCRITKVRADTMVSPQLPKC